MRAVVSDPRPLGVIRSSRAGQLAGGASASVLLGLGVLHAAWGTGSSWPMASRAGHTDLISPTSTGDRFRRLDRRFYSPLCLTLAALTWLSVPGATT